MVDKVKGLYSLKTGQQDNPPNVSRIKLWNSPLPAPLLNVYLSKNTKSKNDNIINSEQKSTENSNRISLEIEQKIQIQMTTLISKIDDWESIKIFKQLYREIISKEEELTTSRLVNKSNFLHEAALHGNLEIGKFLLKEMNQDPNMVSKSLWTPLQLACQNGEYKFVELLLNWESIDPDIITDYERGSATEISWNNISYDSIMLIKRTNSLENINDKYLNCLKEIYKFKNLTLKIDIFKDK